MYEYLGHCINDELSDDDDMTRQRNKIYAQWNALLLLLNFITDSLLHICAGKYDSCPKYKHYNKDTTLQTTDIVISCSVLHAMNIKQPPPVGTYS